jgi:L-Ala-D/L-Glu epimerase
VGEKIKLTTERTSYATKDGFTISRGTLHEIITVNVRLTAGEFIGEGECRPYARYDETPENVLNAIQNLASKGEFDLTNEHLQNLLPPGAARNVIDCALYDLKAKKRGEDLWDFFSIDKPRFLRTAVTVDLREPQEMLFRIQGLIAKGVKIIKIKCGDSFENDFSRLQTLIKNQLKLQARFILDPNEGWIPESYLQLQEHFIPAGVVLIEQPFPQEIEEILAKLPRPVAVCADESFHDEKDLPRIAALYDAVNIKLDKTGGLTGAFKAAAAVREAGLQIMVGCMTASSRAILPATLIAVRFSAEFVDLDGPLFLSNDIEDGLIYQGDKILLASAPIRPKQFSRHLKALSDGWKIIGSHALTKTIKTKNFADSLAVANQIGAVAEALDHHPDITVRYHACEISVTTHDADNLLTEKDFILAKKIDEALGN